MGSSPEQSVRPSEFNVVAIGPGPLFINVLPNLLVRGVAADLLALAEKAGAGAAPRPAAAQRP